MSSPPPLRFPCTIHYHQHIHRIREGLAGVKQFLSYKFSGIYQFFLFSSSPIFDLSIYYFMKEKVAKFKQSLRLNLRVLCRVSRLRINPFFYLLMYLLFISFMGFLVLKALRTRNPDKTPKDIDMFFTAVSAATLSSLTTIEMEVFSNSQLIVLTIMILLGGEAFTSLLDLQLKRLGFKHNTPLMEQNVPDLVPQPGDIELNPNTVINTVTSDDIQSNMPKRNKEMKNVAILYLSYIVLGYLLVMHIGGMIAIMAYLYSVADARRILSEKGLNIITFSVFATVSTFSNCGFLPTNESMVMFKKNLGLLLLVMPQSLLGGAMYPLALSSVLWFLKRITKRNKFEYILKKFEQIGYEHLFPRMHSLMLALTVLGILLVQFVLICVMEWRNAVTEGLNLYEKLVNYLFLAVNARHTGESILNLARLTPVVLVLCIFVMYLPPYTTFIPFEDERSNTSGKYSGPKSLSFFRLAHLSSLSYLAIFVMIICITERDKISDDPLNFNIINIVFEIVSAYGNVGYSLGYSCNRRLATNNTCKNSWTSFSGRWSTSGKSVLIGVMLLGGLKRYTMRGGKAWKLSCKT